MLTLIVVGCKKQNEDHIVGTWQLQNYYYNGIEATISYGYDSDQSWTCNNGPTLYYNPYSSIIKDEWKFDENGTFENFNVSNVFSFDEVTSCSLGYTVYEETSSANDFTGNYSISDDGEGDKITLNINEASIDGDILRLDENSFEFSFTFEGETHKYYLIK